MKLGVLDWTVRCLEDFRAILSARIAVIICAVSVSPVWSFTGYGAGTLTCAEMVSIDREYGKNEQFEQWVWGYFSGRNFENDSATGSGKMNAENTSTSEYIALCVPEIQSWIKYEFKFS